MSVVGVEGVSRTDNQVSVPKYRRVGLEDTVVGGMDRWGRLLVQTKNRT